MPTPSRTRIQPTRSFALSLGIALMLTLIVSPALADQTPANKAEPNTPSQATPADQPGTQPNPKPNQQKTKPNKPSTNSKPTKQDPPKRKVDLKLIANPAHKQMNLAAPKRFKAHFKTTAGSFTVEVTRAWAPNGADRFYNLVRNGYYDGTRFYRVVPNFVVQWGIHGNKTVNAAWYNPKNQKTARLKDDPIKQSNTRGRLTFANAGPNTRSTQLFINLRNNTLLDDVKKMRGAIFAPFGQINAKGMKVVDKLYSGYGDPPRHLQSALVKHGNVVLDRHYPKLDAIITATIVPPKKENKPKQPQAHNPKQPPSKQPGTAQDDANNKNTPQKPDQAPPKTKANPRTESPEADRQTRP